MTHRVSKEELAARLKELYGINSKNDLSLKMHRRGTTKEDEVALLRLKEIYGMNRPTDISHQLHKIYGIDMNPRKVSRRLSVMESNVDRSFTNDQLIEAWELQKEYGFNWSIIGQKLKQSGDKSKMVVRETLVRKYRLFLRRINSVFGQDRLGNQEKLNHLRSEAISCSFQLYQDANPPQDEQYLQVQERARYLVVLFDKMFRIEFQDNEDLFRQLHKFTNKVQIQQMLEHLFLLNTMQKIAVNKKLTQRQKNEQQFYFYDKKDQKRILKFNYVKTWEDAENLQIQQNDYEETKDELHLTEHEIQLIKGSPLYQKLFQNPQKKFLDFYNEAVLTYSENKKFTYVINENSKTHQVPKVEKVEQIERNKQNAPMPLWKKSRNEREIYPDYHSIRFLNDFLDGVKQVND